jgi:hypothetical protein
MDSLLELFCHALHCLTGTTFRPRVSLCMSEIMTILIHFHQSNYRNFYLEHVMTHLRNEFPGLVSSC